MQWTPRLKSAAATARRLSSRGWSTGDVASICQLTRDEACFVLGLPIGRRPLTGAARAIKGRTATEVRRLLAAGVTPADVAFDLDLDPGAVAELAERLIPRQSRPLRRPRKRREQAQLSPWPRCRDDDPAGIEALPAEAATTAAALERFPAPPIASRPIAIPAEEWGSPAGGVGARSPNAALSDDDAELVRQLRADGVPRKDVAARLGVSVATITRITRGETYRLVVAGDDLVVAGERPAELPEIAAAEPMQWVETGDRRHRGD